MTADWEVGRGKRTARRSSAISRGGSPLMPSHSQGAERRPERRAGHTGSRWLLRALVVGGLAGVAWLLTGSATYAAESGDGPYSSSPGPVPRFAETGYEPTVGELLEAAVQPPESAPQIHRSHAVTSILTAPERVLSDPVDMLDEVGNDDSAIDALPLPAGPSPRTSGGTADDRVPAAPAERVAETTFELLAEVSPADAVRAPARVPKRAASDSTRADRAGVTPARMLKAQPRSRIHRHLPAARPAPEVVRGDVPGDDGPVSRRLSLGVVSGIPAGGPGACPESGPVAALPARFANGAVDDRRLPLAADVEARRHDAEAPTVSPD